MGFQCHLTVGEEFDSTKFDNNIKRYASLGLECTVTELDMSIPDLSAPDAYERQAAEYAALVDVMMKYDHCRAVVVWGVKDDQSWRQGAPLLFNAAMEAKPAFFALRNILEEYAQTGGVENCTVSTETLPPYVDVYDVMGRSVALQLERSQREFAFRFLYCRGAGHIDSLIFHFVLINDFENVAFLMSV